ncbi:hypothetical protein SCP_1001950 [Sparassis crispa]|uniref:Palmitoyltransferase n=1 Tax=Sparassis crispa TaxID=139825 RepID=A0A401GXL5_9APHY|nr:hypothetical protein SCP_1001950 [Sparassis crispa]GBE86951.1 hypothetical protein SCP_1001950 [Sparassis crispa]
MAKHDTSNKEQKCCGIVEEAREKRAAKRNKPQPWIVLKLTIGLTLGIIAYGCYVYIGRFCVPMIKHNDGPLGGRGMGVGFLVVFCIFTVLMVWSYLKVIFTSPGHAKHYVQKSPRPMIENPVPAWWDWDPEIGMAYWEATEAPVSVPPLSQKQTEGHHNHTVSSAHSSGESDGRPSGARREDDARHTGVLPPVTETHAARLPKARTEANGNAHMQYQHPPRVHNKDSKAKRMPRYTRKVPKTPVLLPEHRYCSRDGFIKPLRAHHCRVCGTCVLQYDHHCPWIGQCVGARNHKFFINFLQWAFFFCVWTFSTLLAGVIKAGAHGSPDPQEIVIVALSGLFTIFTIALLVSQVYLTCRNQTTVESLGVRRMKEREKWVMGKLFAWYEFGAKRRTRREWDEEWGDLDTEGHIWWLGSSRKNWESVMGHHVWEWFLPIGRSSSDGLSYPHNPRFDSEGRWRPRNEWPAELR